LFGYSDLEVFQKWRKKNIILAKYIMALMVSSNGKGVYANAITNRTAASGGSCGGNKKAGTFSGSVGWPRGNMAASVFWRAPQRPTVSCAENVRLSTRNPVQYARGSYAITHAGTLLG